MPDSNRYGMLTYILNKQLELKKFLYLSLSFITMTGLPVAADTSDVDTDLSGFELFNSIPAENFQSIVGGTISPFASTPFAVALFRRLNANTSSYLCSASLVSQRHVITAGHCVVNEITDRPLPASQLFVCLLYTSDAADVYSV